MIYNNPFDKILTILIFKDLIMITQKIQDFSFSNLVDKNNIKYTREKPLLILDLDEVVVHTITSQFSSIKTYKNPNWITFEKANLTNNFKDTYYHFFVRNGFFEFYNKIKEHYQVGIWSSSAPDYVYNIVKNVFKNPEELSFIWSRNKTVEVPLNKYQPTSDYQSKYIKDLIKLRRRGVSLKQTVVADDTPLKLERQYGNLIPIKPYKAESEDDVFYKLYEYLISLKNENNFRIIEKRFWYNEQ